MLVTQRGSLSLQYQMALLCLQRKNGSSAVASRPQYSFSQHPLTISNKSLPPDKRSAREQGPTSSFSSKGHPVPPKQDERKQKTSANKPAQSHLYPLRSAGIHYVPSHGFRLLKGKSFGEATFGGVTDCLLVVSASGHALDT